MQTPLALLCLFSAASALSTHQSSIQQSPKAYRKDAAQYREQASALREEAAILETELIKERRERDALFASEESPPAATTPVSQPVLVASAGDVEVRWVLEDDNVLRAKVAAGDATLDLEGSWRASGKSVKLAASGLGVRVACEAPMMEAQSVRAARDQRRRCTKALAHAERSANEAVVVLVALDEVEAPAGPFRWLRRRLTAARRRRATRLVSLLAARTIADARADARRWDDVIQAFDGGLAVTLDGVDRFVGASGAIECVGLRAAVRGGRKRDRPLFARCSFTRDVSRRRARSGGHAGGAKLPA